MRLQHSGTRCCPFFDPDFQQAASQWSICSVVSDVMQLPTADHNRHQDGERCLSLWLTLVSMIDFCLFDFLKDAVDEGNGTLSVIPGSHKGSLHVFPSYSHDSGWRKLRHVRDVSELDDAEFFSKV
jgi:hypothetical protein